MLSEPWGDIAYVVMIVVGILVCFIPLSLFLNKKGYKTSVFLDVLICGSVAIIAGIIFANLFQNLYDLILDAQNYHYSFGLTFFGGLFGGVVGFLIIYQLYYKKRNDPVIKDILIIAPLCITIAHGIGRIGCFLDGCCYGMSTDAWYGIYFSSIGAKVVPTQLFESAFLLLLSALLWILIFKYDFKYTFVVYGLSYSIWRFIIEFIRDDYRGAFLGPFSPSQIWCMFIFVSSFVLLWFLKNKIFVKTEV